MLWVNHLKHELHVNNIQIFSLIVNTLQILYKDEPGVI